MVSPQWYEKLRDAPPRRGVLRLCIQSDEVGQGQLKPHAVVGHENDGRGGLVDGCASHLRRAVFTGFQRLDDSACDGKVGIS